LGERKGVQAVKICALILLFWRKKNERNWPTYVDVVVKTKELVVVVVVTDALLTPRDDWK